MGYTICSTCTSQKLGKNASYVSSQKNIHPESHLQRSNENFSFQSWMWYSSGERQLIIDFSESQPEGIFYLLTVFKLLLEGY